jgi:hypothetical protein
MKEAYYFGRFVRQIDLFAYPRTGSHLFLYVMSGLFDLVGLPHDELHNAEAIARQREISENTIYGLDLREDGVPYTPVFFNALRQGVHGRPAKGADPMVILIRDPLATVYSLFRVNRDRWKTVGDELAPGWIEDNLRGYLDFYQGVMAELSCQSTDVAVVRYERLLESTEPLEQVVRLVGVRPKLRPAFVHWLVQFQNMMKAGERTFYRAGRNDAWREDQWWTTLLRHLPEMDFRPFGYGILSEYLDGK